MANSLGNRLSIVAILAMLTACGSSESSGGDGKGSIGGGGAGTQTGGATSSTSGTSVGGSGGLTSGIAGAGVAGGGTAATGGALGTGGTSAVVYVSGVVGAACSTEGARACTTDPNGGLTLIGSITLTCTSGKWVSTGYCPQGEQCDSRPGPTSGTCQPYDTRCTSPSKMLCNVPDNNLWRCDPWDMTTSLLQTCDLGCSGELQCAPPTGCADLWPQCDCSGSCTSNSHCACFTAANSRNGTAFETYSTNASQPPTTGVIFRITSEQPTNLSALCKATTSRRAVDLNFGPLPLPGLYRVRTTGSWYVTDYVGASLKDVCTLTDNKQCIVGNFPGDVWAYTDAATPSDVNVLVEVVPNGTTCP